MFRRATLILLATAACGAFGLAAGAPAATATPLNCPGGFQVLHDDEIGDLQIPAGAYEIKVGDPARLACVAAVADFAEFLTDYDGVLRRPWVQVPGRQIFSRGDGSLTAFSIRRLGDAIPAASPLGNPTANACPGFFRVLHDDHIGSVPVAADPYRITLLDPASLTCLQAAQLFNRFLRDVDGALTQPWRFDGRTATFRRGRNSTVGFRVKAAVGVEPDPTTGKRFPPAGQPRECKGAFRARANDRIGPLNVTAGEYLLFPARGSRLSCKRVAQLFGRFLGSPKNGTPKGWKVDGGNGTFRTRKRPGFRVKPAFKVVARVP